MNIEEYCLSRSFVLKDQSYIMFVTSKFLIPRHLSKLEKSIILFCQNFNFFFFTFYKCRRFQKCVRKGICICILLIQPQEQSTKAVCVYGQEYYVNDLKYKFLHFTSEKRCFSNFLTFSCTWKYIVCFLILYKFDEKF